MWSWSSSFWIGYHLCLQIFNSFYFPVFTVYFYWYRLWYYFYSFRFCTFYFFPVCRHILNSSSIKYNNFCTQPPGYSCCIYCNITSTNNYYSITYIYSFSTINSFKKIYCLRRTFQILSFYSQYPRLCKTYTHKNSIVPFINFFETNIFTYNSIIMYLNSYFLHIFNLLHQTFKRKSIFRDTVHCHSTWLVMCFINCNIKTSQC